MSLWVGRQVYVWSRIEQIATCNLIRNQRSSPSFDVSIYNQLLALLSSLRMLDRKIVLFKWTIHSLFLFIFIDCKQFLTLNIVAFCGTLFRIVGARWPLLSEIQQVRFLPTSTSERIQFHQLYQNATHLVVWHLGLVLQRFYSVNFTLHYFPVIFYLLKFFSSQSKCLKKFADRNQLIIGLKY